MKSPDISQRRLAVYGACLALGALGIVGWMLASPSEPGSSVLLGLSLPRLALALGLILASVILSALTAKAARDRVWAASQLEAWFGRGRFSRIADWLGWASLGLGWTGLFLPAARLGRFEGYWARVQPLFAFLLLAGLATLTLLYVQRKKSPFVSVSNRSELRLGLWLFLASLPVLGFMLVSRFGVSARDDFWYGAGVPILAAQLIAAVAGGLLFMRAGRKWGFQRLDLAVFVLLFAVTAFFWAREPLREGFSFIANPPNNILYPIFDPATYDAASQFPLIGQKIFIFNGYFFERPLYLAFLTYLHALFGQEYAVLMAAQAAVLAVLPGLIYLIGRSLDFRAAGFAAALAALFRGLNAIAASNMIDLANPKMILTDFPAAIGVALVTLAVCEWLKQPGAGLRSAVWTGGALGFALMLRTNSLLLLGAIGLSALLKFSRDWKKLLAHSLLIALGVIAITLPWELRNRALGGQMYEAILVKFRGVIDQRYSGPSGSLPILQSLLPLSTLYPGDLQTEAACDSAACFVPNHFLHNTLTSLLVLPTSPLMDDLRATVRDNNPYWYPRWDGAFAPSALAFLLLNLFFILLGVGAAWKKAGLPGLAPLAVFVFYNLSNSFARTSGGRYVVPMDWIVVFYFLLGLFLFIAWMMKTVGSEPDPEPAAASRSLPLPAAPLAQLAPALVLLLGFGSLLPLAENLYPDRYRGIDPRRTLVEHQASLTAAGLDGPSLEAFLQAPEASLFVGRALFPRHYKIDEGHTYYYPNVPLPFPRLTFNLIGPDGNQAVVLPGGVPGFFPHAGDVLVVGCRAPEHVDALAVVVLDGQGAAYVRTPAVELTCPLREPLCDNNSVCR